jgi:hypothetical protein
METYKFDAVKMSEELWGVLRRLGEMWPDELRMQEIVELNCFSPRSAEIVAHLGGERANHESKAAAQSTAEAAPVCLQCGKSFERRQGGNKFCSQACSRAYYNEKRKKQPPQDEGTNADGTQIYLDIQTGDILSIQEINQGLRNGEYGHGRRFRGGDTRVYVVEQVVLPGGALKWKLKKVVGQWEE